MPFFLMIYDHECQSTITDKVKTKMVLDSMVRVMKAPTHELSSDSTYHGARAGLGLAGVVPVLVSVLKGCEDDDDAIVGRCLEAIGLLGR